MARQKGLDQGTKLGSLDISALERRLRKFANARD
jgi:hypothetical protein